MRASDHRDAIEARDYRTSVYFKSLVRRHDDGRFASILADDAPVEITVHPADARFRLERIRTTGPLHLPEPWVFTGGRLPIGSYRLVAELEGYHTVNFPFVVDPDRMNTVSVEMPRDDGHLDGFVYVHGAAARLGGDSEAPGSLPAQEVVIDSFFLARDPVTLAEYVEFLNGMVAEVGVEGAQAYAPRSPEGRLFVKHDVESGSFQIPSSDGEGDAWHPRWPVLMVNYHDATAFAQWRSKRDGKHYRLPNELEWEYAARGADQRGFPWGNGFDSNIACCARAGGGSRRGPARIDEFRGLPLRPASAPGCQGPPAARDSLRRAWHIG